MIATIAARFADTGVVILRADTDYYQALGPRCLLWIEASKAYATTIGCARGQSVEEDRIIDTAMRQSTACISTPKGTAGAHRKGVTGWGTRRSRVVPSPS